MTPRHHPRRRRAYSLVELIAVMALVATLAVSAAPALRWMERSRDAALEREARRMLAVARAGVIATGRPTGVRFDTAAQTLSVVTIAEAGDPPTAAPGPTGTPSEARRIETEFPGASVVSVVNGDGGAASDTIWFGYAGAPEVRDAAGDLVGAYTTDAVVTISGGRTITVRRATGMIE